MYILQAWKDSLTIFYPSNLKLFLLVTFNALVKGYITLIKSAWPLILPLIVLYFFILFSVDFNFISLISTITSGIMSHAFIFLWWVAIRPSVGRKTTTYFLRYLARFWYLILFLYLVTYVFGTIVFSLSTEKTFQVGALLLSFFATVILLFLLFFVLDSDGSFESLWLSSIRAGKMFLYNLPACIVIFFLVMITGLLAATVFATLFNLILFYFIVATSYRIQVIGALSAILVVGGIIAPFQVCFFGNYYIKKLHDQFDLYFQQP